MSKAKTPAGARTGARGDNKPIRHLYLIDGSGFIFRAYHSLPPLTRSDGTPTGAVYGFINPAEDRGDYAAMLGWFVGQVMKSSGGKASPQ